MSYRKVRLIPFIYSSEIAYVIELGNYYARFFYDGDVLLNGDNEAWIETPYAAEDIYVIQFHQQADVMWLFHPTYAPRTLTRTGPVSFTLAVIEFRGGPFLTRNDLIDLDNPSTITLACSDTALDANVTVTASDNVFLPGHVGALFQLIHPRSTTQIEQNAAGTSDEISVKGTWTFYTHGTWTGTVLIERQENGGDWETFRSFNAKNDRNIGQAYVENYDNVLYRITVEDGLTGNIGTELSVSDPSSDGIVKITAVTSPTSASGTIVKQLESTDATIRWAEGAWSEVRGYPRAITFFEDRLICGGPVALSSVVNAYDYPTLLNSPEIA